MANIKYGQGWLEIGMGTGIGALPLGKSVIGNITNNMAKQLIRRGYDRFSDENITFVSASRHIARRYIGSLATRHLYSLIRVTPRSAYRKEFERRIERMKKNKVASDKKKREDLERERRVITEGNVISPDEPIVDPHTGNEIKDYLRINVPSDVIPELRDNSIKNDFKFIDVMADVAMSTQKNVVLTTVQGRDTTRKEYISEGDLKFTINGTLVDESGGYPLQQRTNLSALLSYRGILEVGHRCFRAHNITHILVTAYSFPMQKNFTNTQDYVIECVGIAPSKKIEYKTAVEAIVQTQSITINEWVNDVKLGNSKKKPSKILKQIQKWL